MRLPTALEICPIPGCLDGEHALKTFFGKSLEQAGELFADNFFHYQEDLMYMGPAAFCFYVKAAISYFESEQSAEDYLLLYAFPGLVESQNSDEPLPASTKEEVLAAIDYVLESWIKFAGSDGGYGPEKKKWIRLRGALSA